MAKTVSVRMESYVRVVEFTNDAVSKEITILRNKLQDYQRIKSNYNKLISNGQKVSQGKLDEIDSLLIETTNKIKKINQDKLKMDLMLRRINNINGDNSLTSDEKEKKTQAMLKPFFKKYNNFYDGTSLTQKTPFGTSQFNRIIRQTNIYQKFKDKIDKLDSKITRYENLRNAKNKGNNAQLRALKNRKKILESKKIKSLEKQKIIMLRREMTIRKRNARISTLEAERTLASNKGKTAKEIRIDKKLTSLKGKRIFQMPGRVIMFTQYMSDFARRRHFDKQGNIDKRRWTERRIAQMQENSKKTL